MIDLRSDTLTQPTPAMRRAVFEAEVGDDCFGEDPSVRALEEAVAPVLGKERALFFPSGIMANQTGIFALGSPGEEVLAEASSHIIHYEEGSVAAHGGLSVRGIVARDGILTLRELELALRPPSPFQPRTSILSLENSHLASGGRVMSADRTAQLSEAVRETGIRVHLDGARLWNAAVAGGISVAELAGPADTVMVSLSKGLGAPVGSMLAGAGETMERAWRIRRRLGGQMRQAGFLAAAGLHAFRHHRERLGEDHRRARELGRGLAARPGIQVVPPETNVVMIDVAGTGLTPARLAAALREREVLVGPYGSTRLRAVLHLGVDDGAVARALDAFTDVLERPA